jgi:hypothetical protein
MADANLISGDFGTDTFYLHDGFTTTESSSISSPSSTPFGVAWYSDNLYSIDKTSDTMYQHSGFTTTISDSVSVLVALGGNPQGITTDADGNLYECNSSGPKTIYQLDGFSVTIDDSFTPTPVPYGLTWDGTNIYTATDVGDDLVKFTGFSSTIDTQINSPSTQPMDVAWDGTNLLSCDRNTDTIYQHSGFSTTILDSIAAPALNPSCIEWDNRLNGAPVHIGQIIII